MSWTCEKFQRRLIDREEGGASAIDIALAKLHLAACVSCRRYVAQLLTVRRALSALATHGPSEGAEATARGIFRRAVRGTEAC